MSALLVAARRTLRLVWCLWNGFKPKPAPPVPTDPYRDWWLA